MGRKRTKDLKIEHVERASGDLLAESVAQLKRLFPEVVAEDKIDFAKLREALGDEVDDRPERYSFTWVAKRDAIRLLQAKRQKKYAVLRIRSCDKCFKLI